MINKFNNYTKDIKLNEFNYESNNLFILFDSPIDVLKELNRCNYNLLGFTKVPYKPKYDIDCLAAILENKNTTEKKWCYVPYYCIKRWRSIIFLKEIKI